MSWHSTQPDNKPPPHVFNVAAYGAWHTDPGRNRREIQRATDDALEAGNAIVEFPPGGGYEIDGPIVVKRTGDTDARVAFAGQVGRRGTRIVSTSNVDPIFDFSTTSGNLRGITMRDLSLYGGSSALRLEKCSYLSFENLSFMNQRAYSIDAVNSYGINFTNGWWVHLAGDVASTVNGSLFFDGCHFGEDAGNFYSNGLIKINGGRVYQCNGKQNVEGSNGMGREVFTVNGGGRLHVDGALISGVVENLLNVDNADEVTIQNCQITAGAGSLLTARRADGAYPIQFQNNTIRVPQDAALFDSTLGRTIGGVFVTGNSFLVDEAATFDMATPEGSIMEANMVWGGAF